ncbi:MAG: Jag N-terminal domain-containing protein [Desulfovibrio sp.]|nr:Jag N-terminal domain-containing protein [Desulfovibrio sp.]
MENFKEFKGKSLDEAIEEACSFFNTAREKLEIEIIQDAKTGIFGIVGACKAKVRARRVELREAVESILGKHEGSISPLEMILGDDEEDETVTSPPKSSSVSRSAARRGEGRPKRGAASTATAENEGAELREQKSAVSDNGFRPQEEKTAATVQENTERMPRKPGIEKSQEQRAREDQAEAATGRQASMEPMDPLEEEMDAAAEDLPFTPLEQLDAARLESLVRETVRQLIRPLVDAETPVEVRVGNGRVYVHIACDGDSGLLIGRDGQTLGSLQYMVSRIVSRGMNAAVRVQLDAGEYRRRQDGKLRDMALFLAEKVRQTGRSYSTRPLSSYHRRIVHLCLQDVPDIQTRSNGDGPLKRVVIMRKKEGV